MSRIDGEGRENREDLRLEELIYALPFLGRQLLHADEPDSVLLQLGQQHVVKALLLLRHELGYVSGMAAS